MSDRKQVSRKKTTASNSSNPSLAPNIPSLPTPSRSLGVESHQTTPQTVKQETSPEVEQVADEQQNQENINLKESAKGLAFDSTNYLQNVSFRPRHRVHPQTIDVLEVQKKSIQGQELEDGKEEELEHEEDSELIQTKLNLSQVGGKPESVSKQLSKNFQLQLKEEDKLDKPIESFNYLEKATIFRPQETLQRQELDEETEQQELDGIIQAKCSECEREEQEEVEDTKTVQAKQFANPVNQSSITEEELSETESQTLQTKPTQPLTISSVSPRIQGSWITDRIAGFANNIPGFSLLTLILGKNPITDKPVKRNPTNIIRGVLGLVPGGDSFFANLQQSGALNKAFTWFQEQIAILNITWAGIKGLFQQAYDSIGWRDLANISGAWERIKNIFLPPIQRIKNFAIALGKKVMEFVFEGVMSKVGGGGARVMGIIQGAGKHFTNIIKNPIGFVGNLVAAVRGGFSKFSANIGTHLQNGLTGWLFGALGSAGLTLPAQFNPKGIVSIVLQVLGITYDQLRTMLAKRIGEPRVAKLEQAFEFLRTIVTGGLGAAWQKITEFVGNLQETVIGGIRQWVQNSVIKAAIVKLISMFNPAGAIVQAVMAIYNTIQFFIERGSQIAALAQSVFSSIGKIAAGNVGGAANYVEQTMARTLPVTISFLARLIGLGGIGGQIRNIIKRVQAPVEKGMNKLASFIVSKAKGLFKGKKGKDKDGKFTEKERKAGLAAFEKEEKPFVKDGAITQADARKVGKIVKDKHPVFKSITVVDGKDSWDYKYIFKSEKTKDTKNSIKAENFVPENPVSMSNSHSISTITSKTRFGDGQLKTIANGSVDIKSDIDEINSGKAVLNKSGDIVTNSGRIYGRHPGRDTIFLRSGSPETVDLTKAEFSILRDMIKSGGLTGHALRAFEGMQKAGNQGLSGDSQQKLLSLFDSK